MQYDPTPQQVKEFQILTEIESDYLKLIFCHKPEEYPISQDHIETLTAHLNHYLNEAERLGIQHPPRLQETREKYLAAIKRHQKRDQTPA